MASVPVAARQAATGGQLGNQVGVMPVALPAGGGLATRVTQIAAITRQRKTAARGTSAVVLGLPVRLLAPTGLLRWLISRQRRIHTFVTSVRGPAGPLSFAGAPVRAVIAIPNTIGNVRAWISTWNQNPRPFTCAKTAEEILSSLARYLERISGAGH